MVNDPFNVLLNSLCYYFIEIFASLFIKVLFSGSSLSGFDIRVTMTL